MLGHFLENSKSLRGVFRLLWLESIFAIVFETWVSPVYLSGLSGELNISIGFVSFLSAIPWIGATGQIFGVWAFERSRSVKFYVLSLASLGRAFLSIPLFLSIFWGWNSYKHAKIFPISKWFMVAAFCACFSSMMVSASTNAWLFWMQNLIPSKFQGRFFGLRQRFSTSALTVASVLAAFLVGWSPNGFRIGFALLCFLGFISGGISIYLHSHVSDIPSVRNSALKPRSFYEILQKPFLDREFRQVLFFGAIFNGAVQLISSYFPYYFTRELQIPISTIALWTGISNLGAFAASNYWGKRLDRSEQPMEIIWLTGHLIALSPLMYFVVKDRSLIMNLAPIDYLISGLAWSGFTLAQTKLLFRHSQAKNGSYFSVYAAVCGLAGAIGTFIGGQVADYFTPWGGFRCLWLFGFVMRLGVLWLYCRPLLQPSSNKGPIGDESVQSVLHSIPL